MTLRFAALIVEKKEVKILVVILAKVFRSNMFSVVKYSLTSCLFQMKSKGILQVFSMLRSRMT